MAAQQKLSQPPTSKDKTFDQWVFWLWQRVVAAGQNLVSSLYFSSTQRVAGRNSAGVGVGEEVTATQLLDWVGSTNGDILQRGASAWGVVAPGDLTKADDTNVTLTLGGTPTGSLLKAASITAGWTGTLAETRGGTNQSSYTTGDLLYASASNTLSKLADVATGNALVSGGIGAIPSWGKIGLTTHVSGTLPVANGGTNLTGYTANRILYATATDTLGTSANLTYNGSTLSSQQFTSTVATGIAPLVVTSTTAVANLNASLLLGSTWAAPAAIGSGTPAAGTFTTLSSTGNTTLGDASGDTLTINAGTWTVSNTSNVNVGSGAIPFAINCTNQNTVAADFPSVQIMGTCSPATASSAGLGALKVLALNSGSAAINNNIYACSFTVQQGNSQNITRAKGVYGQLALATGAGGTISNVELLRAQAYTAAGGVTTAVTLQIGLRIDNMGGSLVTTAKGISIDDFSGSTTMLGIQSSLSSGSGKFNLYCDGTAQNYLNGELTLGTSTSGSAALTFGDAKNIAVGSTTGTKIGTATTQKLGMWGVTPVVQPATTGTTAGFTAGAGTTVDSAATFTGNIGTAAYTIGDVVLALKQIGVLAA